MPNHYYVIKVSVDRLTIQSVHDNEEESEAPLIFDRKLFRAPEHDDVILVTNEAVVMPDFDGRVRIKV